MSLARGATRSPEETIMVNRLGIVIAEVTLSIEAKAELRAQARTKIGRFVDELCRLREDVMTWLAAFPPESTSDARAALLATITAGLVTEFQELGESITRLERSPNGSLVEEVLRERSKPPLLSVMEEILAPATARRDALTAQAAKFAERFETDLRADAARQREIAADWSAVDGDGLK
jgi:hypothetical protein